MLIVDDSEDGARSLARLFKLWGHSVRVAHDGPEAIEIASEHRPEVVFLDIGLPGMDGYEVCRRLGGDSALSGTIFVALTGWGSEDDKKRAQDAGFGHHLVKPIGPDEIEAVLRQVMDGREGGAVIPA